MIIGHASGVIRTDHRAANILASFGSKSTLTTGFTGSTIVIAATTRDDFTDPGYLVFTVTLLTGTDGFTIVDLAFFTIRA